MVTRSFVIISVSVLVIAGLIAALQFCWAQPLEGDEDQQVVAAVAAQ